MTTQPFASVSLDLDNLWSYQKTHGDAGWETFPSYLDVFVPYTLDALAAHGLTITFFVVGQDAALPRNHDALRLIGQRGHEIGNHSFHHEQWMLSGSRADLARELTEAAEAITGATGRKPEGYRGPGFCWSSDLFEVLAEQGYRYDASTLPTYIGPLARRYYFRQTRMSDAEKQQRKDLFGGFGEGRYPVKPYLWKLRSGRTLLEMPVTTMPMIKLPFHLSYLLYLSRRSTGAMLAYLRTALGLCRATGVQPSFLLHPLDLLGADQAPGLAFFPGMDLSRGHKREIFDIVMRELSGRYTLGPMGEHARRLLDGRLPRRPVSDGSWKKESKA